MAEKPFSFATFVAYIERVAEIKKWRPEERKKLHAGIVAKGGSFSLQKDAKLDSLDSVELVMELEEIMMVDGYDHKGMEGPEFEKADNIGAFYQAICKKAGFEADSELAIAA